MKSYQSYSLKEHNTFALPAVCPSIHFPTSINEIREAFQQINGPFYVLGEGSNTLFIDEATPTIIKPNIKGITVTENGGNFLITAGCGENWHQLVTFCMENGYGGVENLALIPGCVGAAPVQNIGAYGVELADVIMHVNWFEFDTQKVHCFDKDACQFAYRDSIFKKALLGKGIIVDITLSLPKLWQPKLTYTGLDQLDSKVSIADVFQKVIAIRQEKLPDPMVLPNCGSFFKNPIVSQKKFQTLLTEFGEMPAYPQANGTVKLAAGWLIEKAGYKGFRMGDVGVHEFQALVLVNYGTKKGEKLAQLASLVQAEIHKKFNLSLEAEVRVLSDAGLIALNWNESNGNL